MSNLVLTGWTGDEHGIMASHTIPLMKKYADQYNLDFLSVDLYDPDIPASWMKVIHIIQSLEKYEKVLWVDCDIVIKKFDENIFDELNEPYIQALVEHHVDVGDVPNCGLWLVNQKVSPVLQYIWNNKDTFLKHPWWEQASMLNEMGYSVILFNSGFSKVIRPSIVRDHTKFLHPKWNHHPGDSNKTDDPNFMHITMYPDRVGKIKELTST
jgi:lipopolysaccharide biosynthesis glycosyltransferase